MASIGQAIIRSLLTMFTLTPTGMYNVGLYRRLRNPTDLSWLPVIASAEMDGLPATITFDLHGYLTEHPSWWRQTIEGACTEGAELARDLDMQDRTTAGIPTRTELGFVA